MYLYGIMAMYNCRMETGNIKNSRVEGSTRVKSFTMLSKSLKVVNI